MNPELVYRIEMARVLEGRICDALTAQECAGTDLAFHRALKFWRQQVIHGLQLSVETLAPIRDETLPNGGGEIAEFIRALEYCEIPAPKGEERNHQSGSQESRKIELVTQERRKNNLPVPVLAEPPPSVAVKGASRDTTTEGGEARESTIEAEPVRSMDAVTQDSRGGQNLLSGGVESRHADSPCKHGGLEKGGLMPSAHKLVQPNNSSGSSAPPAQPISKKRKPENAGVEQKVANKAKVISGERTSLPSLPSVEVPFPSESKSREVMSQWR